MEIFKRITLESKILHDHLEKSQWNHVVDFKSLEKYSIISKDDIRSKKMDKGFYTVRTSGSTGEPLILEKTYQDAVWYNAAIAREFKWKGWDTSKNIAAIRAGISEDTSGDWGINRMIFPNQGKRYQNGLLPISELQKWLEKNNPHYIHCLPSIFKRIDVSKIPNFIDWKGTGELGGTTYSSEECGIIAIQCPDNSSVMHVMENIIIEEDKDGSAIITSLSNPHIKRYKHGDHLVLGECDCGRSLQTIKEIKGRVRNMLILPNGDKKWPLIGSLEYYERFGIKRFKAIQTSINHLEIQIISDPLNEKENDLIQLVKDCIGSPVEVTIKYVEEFRDYKFEEFISLISCT
jgi:phenylacetate-CoA ligase